MVGTTAWVRVLRRNVWRIGIVVASLGIGALSASAQSGPTVGVSGNPTAPTHIAINTNYSVSVSVTAYSPYNASGCAVYSATGNTTQPTGIWNFHGSVNFSGNGPSGIHTFTVVNQANGDFWWRGYGWDTGSNYNFSTNPNWIGYYATP